MPPPQIIIFIGAILVALGGFLQYREQLEFEKKTNTQLEAAINSIIGGDSYCYVSLQVGGGGGGWISNPVLFCKGKYPMYDVGFRLYDPEDYKEVGSNLSFDEFVSKSILVAEPSNLGVGQSKPFSFSQGIDLKDKERKVLRADISARNGFFSEELLFKKVGDKWLRAMRLYKAFSSELIDEWAEPDFPRDSNGNIIWE